MAAAPAHWHAEAAQEYGLADYSELPPGDGFEDVLDGGREGDGVDEVEGVFSFMNTPPAEAEPASFRGLFPELGEERTGRSAASSVRSLASSDCVDEDWSREWGARLAGSAAVPERAAVGYARKVTPDELDAYDSLFEVDEDGDGDL